MKHYFILNPVAGSGKTTQLFLDKFLILKQNHPEEVELFQTSNPEDATLFAREIIEKANGEEIAIYACGGDGTMSEVATGLIGHPNVSFSVVPVGSCNDFLKSFPDYDFFDLEALINGEDKLIDVVKVDNRYSLNVMNIGFDAKTNYDQILLRQKYKSVKRAYVNAIVKNLSKPLGDQLTIYVDGVKYFEGKALLIAMANAQYYGGGFHCAPKAIVDDGLIDLFLVHKVSVFRFLTLVGRFKKGRLFGDTSRPLVYSSIRGKKIEITSPIKLVGCIDGETVIQGHFSIECLPKYLRFRFPKNK